MKSGKTRMTGHVCMACGSTEKISCDWSGELKKCGNYEGPWIECCGCGLQGPAAVWNAMAEMRSRYGLPMESWTALIHRCGLTLQVPCKASSGAPMTPKGGSKEYEPLVQAFAAKMLVELRANDPEKGSFLAWSPNEEQAFMELEHHVMKIAGALNRKVPEKISEHAADISNICMAIDRVFGAH